MAMLLLGQPRVNATQAKLLLREAYQQSSGIFDHLALARHVDNAPPAERAKIARPWAVLAAHPAQDTSVRSIYGDRYLEYRQANVIKYTGLPWDRFLELMVPEADMILAMCKAEIQEEIRQQQADENSRAMAAAAAELERQPPR